MVTGYVAIARDGLAGRGKHGVDDGRVSQHLISALINFSAGKFNKDIHCLY
jgi:hypothetical protein